MAFGAWIRSPSLTFFRSARSAEIETTGPSMRFECLYFARPAVRRGSRNFGVLLDVHLDRREPFAALSELDRTTKKPRKKSSRDRFDRLFMIASFRPLS